jgi:acetyltransferase
MSAPAPACPERAHDILRRGRRQPLDAIFSPKTVALIGATEKEGSVGCALLKNLCSFDGTVYPVNPKRASVLGIQGFSNIAALPEEVDLAVIATPAPTVPGIIRDCVRAGVPGAIIISAGFKESAPAAPNWNGKSWWKHGAVPCASSAQIVWES